MASEEKSDIIDCYLDLSDPLLTLTFVILTHAKPSLTVK